VASSVRRFALILLTAMFCVFGAATAETPAAEEKKPEVKAAEPAAEPKAEPRAEPAPAAPADINALDTYVDNTAGYSFKIPQGYSKLSPEQNREVFEGLSRFLGKEVGERAERQPPSWFSGPPNPKKPKSAPPSLAVGYTDLDEAVDPAQMPKYKQELEEEYKKRGERFGEIKIDIIKVDGVDSLRVEHDIFSPIDNSRSRMIKISVPGAARRYDIVFNFQSDQAEGVDGALATVLKTFKIDKNAGMDATTQSKWKRIAIWTIGCFFAGILLSLVLKVLAGVGEKKPEESGG
jgi:hypothetical protein